MAVIQGFQTLTASRSAITRLNEKHAGKRIINTNSEAEKIADEMVRQDPLFYLEGRYASMPSQIAMMDAVPSSYATSDLSHV